MIALLQLLEAYANKCMSIGSLLIAELEPIVIAAIKRYKLCKCCGGKSHNIYACPYKENPLSAIILLPGSTG